MNNGAQTITIGGREYPLSLPDFDKREDLVLAWHGAPTGAGLRRIAAAALGLCTPLGKRLGVDWSANGCDLLTYGGKVYSALREQKCSLSDIVGQGAKAVSMCADAMFPREVEVDARADFTDPPADG